MAVANVIGNSLNDVESAFMNIDKYQRELPLKEKTVECKAVKHRSSGYITFSMAETRSEKNTIKRDVMTLSDHQPGINFASL